MEYSKKASNCKLLLLDGYYTSKKNKPIIIVYNSQRKEKNWFPTYMSDYEDEAHPFWTTNDKDKKVGDYAYIKEVLGF